LCPPSYSSMENVRGGVEFPSGSRNSRASPCRRTQLTTPDSHASTRKLQECRYPVDGVSGDRNNPLGNQNAAETV
jgi:hypothetical protein